MPAFHPEPHLERRPDPHQDEPDVGVHSLTEPHGHAHATHSNANDTADSFMACGILLIFAFLIGVTIMAIKGFVELAIKLIKKKFNGRK